MISKIKTLGLALLAFAALGAMAAQAAQAGSLDVGAQPSVVTGDDTGTHVFELEDAGGGITQVTCPVSKFEGTLQGQSDVTEGTVTATYSGNGIEQCKYAFFFNAQVLMNGCKYTITGQSNGSNPALTAWADVVGCTTGKHIEVIVAGGICTLTIDEHNTLGHIKFENMGSGSTADTTAIANVTGIEVTQDGSGCPDGDNDHTVDSGFSGTTTVKAYQDSGLKKGVNLHGHQYDEHLCGSQVALTAT